MRQTQAKGFRRDLRRAVGAEALKTIGEQEQAIRALGLALTQARSEIVGLTQDHAMLKKSTADLRSLDRLDIQLISRLIDREVGHRHAFEDRPLWARLRWLVTGQ